MKNTDALPADVAVGLAQRLYLEHNWVHLLLFHFQFFYQHSNNSQRPLALPSFKQPIMFVHLSLSPVSQSNHRYNITLSEMKALLLLLLLVTASFCGDCTQLDNCDECDWTTDPPQVCITCHGWYESSWDTGLCVLSARLIILCCVMGLLLICVIFCSIIKIQEYRAKFIQRPTNIQSISTESAVTREQLSQLQWKRSDKRINDTSRCNICHSNGGTVRLNCGHVFHGDCICWELRAKPNCPQCNDTNTKTCTVHCMKCLTNYLEATPEMYVDIKKGKSRVCDECVKKEAK